MVFLSTAIVGHLEIQEQEIDHTAFIDPDRILSSTPGGSLIVDGRIYVISKVFFDVLKHVKEHGPGIERESADPYIPDRTINEYFYQLNMGQFGFFCKGAR